MSLPALHLACHCQANIYRVITPAGKLVEHATVYPTREGIKRRAVGTSIPRPDLERIRGEVGPMKDAFGYCSQCGTTLFLPSPPDTRGGTDDAVNINLRAIRCEDTDYFDAHFISPALSVPGEVHNASPRSAVDLPDAEAYFFTRRNDGSQHGGSCVCGAIRFVWRGKPILDEPAYDCGCALCVGNGAVWLDPGRRNIFFHPHDPNDPTIPPSDQVIEYTFGSGQNGHLLCKKCGVEVYEDNPSKGDDGWGINGMLADEAGEFLVDLFNLPPGTRVEGKEQKKFGKYYRHVSMRAKGEPYRVFHPAKLAES